MRTLEIINKSEQDLRLILEPIGSSYDIAPNERVKVVGEINGGGGGAVLEVYPDTCVSIWTTEETVVYKDGDLLAPL